jgi:hypothetical protein
LPAVVAIRDPETLQTSKATTANALVAFSFGSTNKGSSIMEWTFRLTATLGPRVLARVAQIFDQHLLAIQDCTLKAYDNAVEIIVIAQTDEAKASRIQAQLSHLVDMQDVALSSR